MEQTWVLVRFVAATPEFWTGCAWSTEFPDAEHWNAIERYSESALALIDYLTGRDGGDIAFLDVTESF